MSDDDFFNNNNQRIFIAPHFDIIKEILLVQGSHCLADTNRVNRVPNINRYIVEPGTFRYALQPFDSHILNDKRLRRK